MRVVTTIAEMRAARAEAKGTVGVVPTMGALHEGHLSLVRRARKESDFVVATIFVNPAQFGPNEDFERYPRTFEADSAMLEGEGVDLIFAPPTSEIYPQRTSATVVDVPSIGELLDGRSRPGHFVGVATVVAKLFNIVRPDLAFFGQKDAVQVAVLRAMVRDLNFDLKVVVCPTLREADGLAMSSRNRYILPEDREQALSLSHALFLGQKMVTEGVQDAPLIRDAMRGEIESAHDFKFDYAEVVDPMTMLPVERVGDGALAMAAGWLKGTRLIDNLMLEPVAVEAAR